MHIPLANHDLKAILQRVQQASVTVEGLRISTIGKGLLVFAAVGRGDTSKEAESLAAKVLKIKMWEDGEGAKVRMGFTKFSSRSGKSTYGRIVEKKCAGH